MSAVDAAHWWGPFGWLYRNTPGNFAASAIAFVAGWMLKGRQVVRHLHKRLDHHDDALHHIIKHHPDIPTSERFQK